MNENIFVGKEILLEVINPYGNEAKTRQAKISSVKRKYFTVKLNDFLNLEEKFEIETLMHCNGEYSAKYRIWFSEEDYKKSIERKAMIRKCQEFFSYCLTLDKASYEIIEKIYNILKESDLV